MQHVSIALRDRESLSVDRRSTPRTPTDRAGRRVQVLAHHMDSRPTTTFALVGVAWIHVSSTGAHASLLLRESMPRQDLLHFTFSQSMSCDWGYFSVESMRGMDDGGLTRHDDDDDA